VRSLAKRLPRFGSVMQRDLFAVLGALGPVPAEGRGREALLSESFLGRQPAEAPPPKPNDLVGQAAGAKSYNARSGGILGILKAMQDDFTKELGQAQQEELEAEVAFRHLRAAKLGELAVSNTQKGQKEALLDSTVDKNAKAKKEKETTEEEKAANEAELETLERSCEEEAKSHKARAAARTEETRALTEALAILTDDEARSLYAKTMSFIQVAAASRSSAAPRAAGRLADVARRHGSWALASLAARVQLDAFVKVKEAMNRMLAELSKQQKEEYAKWESCKTKIDKTEDNIKAKTITQRDLTEAHQQLTSEIEETQGQLAALEAEVVQTQARLKEAGEERHEQNRVFQTSVEDQRATINILHKAQARLSAYYATRSLVQQGAREGAPPALPSSKPYRKSAAAGGVLQLLDLVVRDAEVTEKELVKGEQLAQADYASFVQAATKSLEADRRSIEEKEARKAAAEAERSEVEEARLANGEVLGKLGDLLKAHHLECDYLLKYFDVRQKARAEEMDAITDAKAILAGASFGS